MLALAAGLIGAYVSSKADPFLTISGGLTGIIAVAAGMDLYHPALIIIIAFRGGMDHAQDHACSYWNQRFKIDDAVGAFPVHGITGTISGILPGIFAVGYIAQPGQAPINFLGQLGGVLICGIGLGFIPGYLFSLALKKFNLLRVPKEVEEQGLDIAELGIEAYPENIGPITTFQSQKTGVTDPAEQTQPSTQKGAYGLSI